MIHSFKYCQKKVKDVGEVAEFRGSLVSILGFQGGTIGEGVVLEDDRNGIIVAAKEEKTIVSLFSKDSVKPGTKAVRTGNQIRITVGDATLGHLISALGYDMDEDKDASVKTDLVPIDSSPPDLSTRRRVTKFIETGVTVCDLVLPLGEGQRELIIGDRKTGKTHFLHQLALSQARKEKVIIYAAIGKKSSEINKTISFFEKNGILESSILVASSASAPPGEIFLTPFTAMAIAEYFRDSGRDSIVILDDLTTHAKYYREISLLAGKFPGRESYPGDIFYTHARILERAGNFDVNGEGVSITALPVAETYGGDFAGYIQTNLASITDGHLYFDSNLFLKGVRPAIDIFNSVTRVGRQTQTPLMRDAGYTILSKLKSYSEMARFLKFGSETTEEAREIVDIGLKLFNLFNQVGYTVYPTEYSLSAAALIISKSVDQSPEKIGKVALTIKPKLQEIDSFQKLLDLVKTL